MPRPAQMRLGTMLRRGRLLEFAVGTTAQINAVARVLRHAHPLSEVVLHLCITLVEIGSPLSVTTNRVGSMSGWHSCAIQ